MVALITIGELHCQRCRLKRFGQKKIQKDVIMTKWTKHLHDYLTWFIYELKQILVNSDMMKRGATRRHETYRMTGATNNHTTVTEPLELQTTTQPSQDDWSYRQPHNCHRTTGATNNHTTVRESLHNLLVHSLPLCVSHQHSHSLTNSDCTFTVASMHFK